MNFTNKQPTIAIIGLGYVGLPLAVAFGKHYSVVGFDTNFQRVSLLKEGQDDTLQCSKEAIKEATHLVFSSEINTIAEAQVYIVTVPTPVDEHKKPDLHSLLAASSMLGALLKKGDIVVYESTVYPGCTEEDCVPVLAKESGLIFNVDFFVGYSPERINPGDTKNTLSKIVKLTSGSTPQAADYIDELYSHIIDAGTYKVSSIKVAEAAKAIENAQRDINISFVNELALIFDKMNIDTHEVLAAAATKWNFLPFKPGLVGGHCIGVDPYYLAHKATQLGHTPQVILSGRKVNDAMSGFITDKLIRLLSKNKVEIKGASILILGVTFKENCPDIRNSKVFDIHHQLTQKGAKVEAFDPFADANEVLQKQGISLITTLKTYDAILVTVAHSFFVSLNYQELKKSEATIIFDTKAILDKKIVTARL